MNSLILVCSGSGARMRAPVNKLLLEAHGHPLVWYTLHNIFTSQLLGELILVCKDSEREAFQAIAGSFKNTVHVQFVSGGATRFESVRNGLHAVSLRAQKILVHDGARPLITGEFIDFAFSEITEDTPVICTAIPCVDTIKESQSGHIVRTLDRTTLFRAQTPQGGYTDLYRRYFSFVDNDQDFSDDSSIFEKFEVPVRLIRGKESFFKITEPEDLERFRQIVQNDECPFRIGEAYDIHQIASERPLIIGGIRIRDTDGLMGHSDADVLIHAVMDALLGAAALPDIGHFFPDTDPTWKGADSIELLARVRDIIDENGYCIGNIDSTIIAEAPKLSPYIGRMKRHIADTLEVSTDQVNVKATTNEKLDSVGHKKGIAATASVLLRRK